MRPSSNMFFNPQTRDFKLTIDGDFDIDGDRAAQSILCCKLFISRMADICQLTEDNLCAMIAAEMTTPQKVSDIIHGRLVEAMADQLPAVSPAPRPTNG